MSNIHSENDPWSDNSDSGTPLPPKLAAAAREVSENMMEMGGDFEIAESIFGKRLSGKATSKKATTLSSRASVTPTPTSSSALSYASMAIDSSPSWSAGRATPTPGPRSKPLDCYDPQPYARFASICQSIRVYVSPILVLFEPATFVYLFS
jgi:hypothetical protein